MLVAVLKQRERFTLFANLRIAPGRFDQGTTLPELFSTLAHESLKSVSLEGLSNGLCSLRSGNEPAVEPPPP